MRNKLISSVAGVAFSFAVSGFAFAADMAVKAPPPAPVPVYNWTGWYVGGNIGGGWGTQNVNYTPNDPDTVFVFSFGGAPPPVSFTSSGVVGGVQLGYNHQLNSNWLVGIETDFDGSGIRGSGSTSGVFAPYSQNPFSAPVHERIDWFGTVRARLGYLPVSNLLAYATGGFAYGRVVQSGSWDTNVGFSFGSGIYSFNCFGANPSCLAGSSSNIGTGWTAGGGLEYSLWQNWTLRAEYLYVSLGSRSVTETVLNPTAGALPSSFNANFSRTNFNIVRVGLNYQFR